MFYGKIMCTFARGLGNVFIFFLEAHHSPKLNSSRPKSNRIVSYASDSDIETSTLHDIKYNS